MNCAIKCMLCQNDANVMGKRPLCVLCAIRCLATTNKGLATTVINGICHSVIYDLPNKNICTYHGPIMRPRHVMLFSSGTFPKWINF